MNPTYIALSALKKHNGDIDSATIETGLLRSFVSDIARKFHDYLSAASLNAWRANCNKVQS